SFMALAPKSSPRRFDVLQQRLAELDTQRQASTKRGNTYRSLNTLSAKSHITAVKAHPIPERLQYAFSASSGQELRAAALEQIRELPDTSTGIANRPFNVKIGRSEERRVGKEGRGELERDD